MRNIPEGDKLSGPTGNLIARIDLPWPDPIANRRVNFRLATRGQAGMIIAILAVLAAAQQPAPDRAAQSGATEIPATAGADDCRSIPADTPLQIEIVNAVTSKTAKTGDRFAIRLAAPLVLAGKTVLPAGSSGIGEVIHASHVTFMGNKPGELIVAARYLDINGSRLLLRGFRINQTGKKGIVWGETTGPIAIANNVDIPAGSIAIAKVTGGCSASPLTIKEQESDR
jgi:hypothetical protein